MTRILGSSRSAIVASHRVRRPDLCRRHPGPPRSQRPSHRSRRREPQTPTFEIAPKGLTTSLQLCQKSTASRAPASQATSSRIAGRHYLGISGRLRRNLHPTARSSDSGRAVGRTGWAKSANRGSVGDVGNPRKSWYNNLERVTTNGDYEVAFHLKRPQPAFLT
jgi:hypothetical protein